MRRPANNKPPLLSPHWSLPRLTTLCRAGRPRERGDPPPRRRRQLAELQAAAHRSDRPGEEENSGHTLLHIGAAVAQRSSRALIECIIVREELICSFLAFGSPQGLDKLQEKSVVVRVRQADIAAAKDAVDAAKKLRPAVTCVPCWTRSRKSVPALACSIWCSRVGNLR